MTTMKLFTISALLAAVMVTTVTAAQSVEPIWLSPTSVGMYPAEFPELGVWSNISVGAGARYLKPIVAMDSKKIIWMLFGSNIYSAEYNVWNYDPKTDLYQWVAGPGSSTTDPRNPGDLRVPSPNNHPGAITSNTGTIDHNDNIWFMGSTPSSNTGELWMFNTSSYYFTRMKGDHDVGFTPSAYGTPGQPSDDVTPGWTYGGCLVVDSFNNLWQIAGITASEGGAKNRIWHFNTTSFQWTFFGGNTSSVVDTIYDSDPLYGARYNQACDIDEDDRVWLFGGIGQSISISFNDVWSYDTRTVQWQLEFGSNASKTASATVTVADDFDAGNQPAAKIHSSFVDRKDGTVLLIGGGSLSLTNDIWQFNKTLKQWKLIYGDPFQQDLAGNFSNYRTPGSVLPAGRNLHGSARGLNIDGDVFIYGGAVDASNFFNDIWLIPQDQCNSSSANKCSSNARCIEAMIGYSCECNDGFVGDGFNCTALVPPMSPPLSTPSSPSNEPLQSPSSSPVSSSQPSTTPHRHVFSGVTVESSLFTVLSLVTLALVSFC